MTGVRDASEKSRDSVSEGLGRPALYRWRGQSVVGPVNHEAVVARIVGESGWSPRYAFTTMMSAGIAVRGLLLSFADNIDTLDVAPRAAVLTSAWAARPWNVPALAVPSVPTGDPSARPNLTRRQAQAVPSALATQGIGTLPAPAAGQRFALSIGGTQ